MKRGERETFAYALNISRLYPNDEDQFKHVILSVRAGVRKGEPHTRGIVQKYTGVCVASSPSVTGKDKQNMCEKAKS